MGYNMCDHDYGVQFGGRRPLIVALCGSTRFKAEFEQTAAQLTMAGVIVVKPDVFMNDGHAEKAHLPAVKEADKAALDELHKRKIDLADEVIVVSDDSGYFGASTRGEIAYAQGRGKPVRYQHPPRVSAEERSDDKSNAPVEFGTMEIISDREVG